MSSFGIKSTIGVAVVLLGLVGVLLFRELAATDSATNEGNIEIPSERDGNVRFVGTPPSMTEAEAAKLRERARLFLAGEWSTDRIEVPSALAGIVKIVGTPLSNTEVEAVDPKEREQLLLAGEWITGALGYLVVEEHNPQNLPKEQCFEFADAPGKKYRLPQAREPLIPGQVRVAMIETTFRKLEVGDRVEKDQVLVLIDPKLAVDELEIKIAQFDAAEAERRAAEKTREEGKKRYGAFLSSRGRAVPPGLLHDEARDAELTWQRYLEEEIAKRAALRQADRELTAALTTLRKHEIRSPVSGVIRKISKQPTEAVKALEPVVQIEFDEEP